MKKHLLIAVILLCGCTASRNRKATARVLSNTALTEQVGRIWEKSNPCVIDTVVQFKNGVEVVRYDTLWNDVVNTVYDTATKTNTVTLYKTIVKYVNRTDTITVDKTDVRRLNLQIADNDKLQAENTQLKTDKSDLKSKLNKRTWEFWGLIGLIAILIGLKIYLPKL